MYTTVTINSSDILLAVINSSDSTAQYSFVLKHQLYVRAFDMIRVLRSSQVDSRESDNGILSYQSSQSNNGILSYQTDVSPTHHLTMPTAVLAMDEHPTKQHSSSC